MKRIITALAITGSIFMLGCKGNPQGAVGENDKGDTTSFDKQDVPAGRPEESKTDTVKTNVGPGSDKSHTADSEDKKKH